jgi:membrane associated rhomboid family serine protease
LHVHLFFEVEGGTVYFFYYLPIGLDVGARRKAFVTYFIAVVCVTLFFVYKYVPFGPWWDLGRLTFQPSAPSLATSVTHVFLHGGYFHLIGNLVYLLIFGPPLEDRVGPLKFFVIFAGSAAAGVYVHLILTALLSPEFLQYGVIGASGATSGILGAYLVRLYFSRVRVAYWVFMPLQGVNRAGRTYLPAALAVVLWFVLQGVLAVMQYGTGGMRVAYGVHLGGFAAGAILAFAFRALGEAHAERHLAKARRSFEAASWFAARAEYIDYLALNEKDAHAHAELARTFVCEGDRIRARPCYEEAVRLHLERGGRGEAEALFEEAMRQVPNFALSEQLHLDVACGMERTLKFRSAMRAYESFLWRYPLSKDAPFVLLRMAGLLERRFDDPKGACACYRRLTSEYSFDRWFEFARTEMVRLETADPSGSAIGNK